MRILSFLTCVALLLQSGCGTSPDKTSGTKAEPPAQGEMTVQEFIASADKIELFFAPPPGPNRTDPPGAVLTDKTAITNFSAGLVLEPKEPCKCKHVRMMRFWRGEKVLIASVCNHCFDIFDESHVVSERRLTRFRMPKGLWTKFCQFEPREQKKDK